MSIASFPDLNYGHPLQRFYAEPVPRLHEAEPDVFARFEGVPGDRRESVAKAGIVAIGAGGLNIWTSIDLARSGVRDLTVVEHDIIEITNLQRQPYKAEDRDIRRRRSGHGS